MAKEEEQKVQKLEAALLAQQEQMAALLSLVAKLQPGAQPANRNAPRGEPKGLVEVRFADNKGNIRRAWLEQKRAFEITEGSDPKNRVVHRAEMADLCVELRPGKFHTIEGVPGLDFPAAASHLVTKARWYTVEQEKAVKRYEEDLKRLAGGATLQQTAKAAPADSDLGLKGA